MSIVLTQILHIVQLVAELITKLSCHLASIVTPTQFLVLKLLICVLPILINRNYQADQAADFLQNVPTDETHWDYIVVGLGSAGALLASRLMSHNLSVLALEAGGEPSAFSQIPGLSFFTPADTKYEWQYKTVPQETCCFAANDQTLLVPRGKVCGGTSVINFMMYIIGNPKDYDKWAAMCGDPSWKYENMKKIICKNEHYTGKFYREHCCGGGMNVDRNRYEGPPKDLFLEAIKQFENDRVLFDKDCNRDQNRCINSIESTVSCGYRWNTFTAFLLGRMFSKRSRIQKFSQVTELVYNLTTAPPTVIGVKYVWHYAGDPTKKVKVRTVYARKEVILCAGAINSPQILLNSGIGPKEDLEKFGIKVISNLQVGKTLKDHVGVPLNFQHRSGCFSSFVPERDAVLNALGTLSFDPDSFCSGDSFLESTYVLGTSFNTSSKSADPDYPDIQNLYIMISLLSSLIAQASQSYFNFKKEELLAWASKGKGHTDGMLAVAYLSRPKSVGSITLNDKYLKLSKPHCDLAPPKINPNYFSDSGGHDLDVLIEAARNLHNHLLNNPVYEELDIVFVGPALLCNEHAPGGNYDNYEFWRCYVKAYTMSIWHWCRSCKMGKVGDPDASVDSRLRVYGVKGLRVVDCSVMPEPPNGNTNAPAIAIAEKAFEMIMEDQNETIGNERESKPCDGTEKPYQLPQKALEQIIKQFAGFKDVLENLSDETLLKLIEEHSDDAEDFKEEAGRFATCSADIAKNLEFFNWKWR